MSSGATRPALAPASIDMLHTVMRPSIESARMAEPRYSITWPMPPPVPISPMIARMTSLAVTPAGSSPSTLIAHPLRTALGQRLGGEHVLDLARADAEGERAERAVGGRVRVAADDGHARQGAALLRADDVDDALVGVAHREVRDAELGGVLAQHLDLPGGDRVGDRLVDVGGRDVVVLGGDGEVGAADLAPDSRRPSNACGLVTSWTRWRSMYSRSGSPGAACTTWRSQTFCGSVVPVIGVVCAVGCWSRVPILG